ncbi:hypothetical protein ETD83_08080 [Actinomadura soli]|uniref:Uncharacterized protein n=1 Tax=Actinomadura soli TaxID=2508997 RepID=A0A5C4JG99_9ACTN|nr:hypothetical protein [Actinomadura soli]TMR04734.1 hypothetical protein ETD83_08080 [Actinomadura soli]
MVRIRRAAVASALVVAFLASTAAAPAGSVLVDGGGFGPTRPTALDAALDDARATAQSIGYYGPCVIVGDPQVFFDPADPYGRFYRAQLQASCEDA